MKQLAVVTALMIAGVLAWIFASRLSADALGMAVGLLAVHYSGLAALQMSPAGVWQWPWVIATVLLAYATATLTFMVTVPTGVVDRM